MSSPSLQSPAAEAAAARVNAAIASAAVEELVRSTERTIEQLHAAAVDSVIAAPSRTVQRAAVARAPRIDDVIAAQRHVEEVARPQAQALMKYLEDHGLAPDLVAALDAWIRLQAAVVAAQRAPAPVPPPAVVDGLVDGDPFEPLSAAQMGDRLHLVAASVRLREQANELFSTLPPGRERGREYPAFQAWPEIIGAPLRRVLEALGEPDGGTAWGFFSSTSSDLEDLTPVEVLSGRLVRARKISDGAHSLLGADAEVRRAAVEGAARAFTADRAA